MVAQRLILDIDATLSPNQGRHFSDWVLFLVDAHSPSTPISHILLAVLPHKNTADTHSFSERLRLVLPRPSSVYPVLCGCATLPGQTISLRILVGGSLPFHLNLLGTDHGRSRNVHRQQYVPLIIFPYS